MVLMKMGVVLRFIDLAKCKRELMRIINRKDKRQKATTTIQSLPERKETQSTEENTCEKSLRSAHKSTYTHARTHAQRECHRFLPFIHS